MHASRHPPCRAYPATVTRVRRFTPPSFKRPHFKRPDFERPDSNRPNFKPSDFRLSEIKPPGIKRPNFERSDFERPDFKHPTFNQSDFKLPWSISQRFAPHTFAASHRTFSTVRAAYLCSFAPSLFNASRRISCSFAPSISFGPYPTRLRSCPRFPGSGFCIGGRRVCHALVPSRLYRRHAPRRERTGCFDFHLRSFVIPLAGTSTAFGNLIFPNVRG